MPNTLQHQISQFLSRILNDIAGIDCAELDHDENLFVLGLDSLMLVQLQQRIEKQYQLSLNMNTIANELESVSKLTHYIEKHGQHTHISAPPIIQLQPDNHSDLRGYDINNIDNESMEAIMTRQLEILSEQQQSTSALLNQQLDILKNLNLNKTSTNPPSSVPPPIKQVLKPSTSTTDIEIPGLYKKNRTQKADNWTTEKQAYIEDLSSRFNEKTVSSKQYAQKYRKVFAHNRNTFFRPEWKEMVYLTAFDHAKGAHFQDIDGNEYLDITMGFGVHLFGHNPDFIQQALTDEIQRGAPIGPVSRLAGDVATLIHEVTGNERTAFFNTGSEAVMVAIRLARVVTGRDKIVVFSGSWHGSFDSVLASGWLQDGIAETVPIAPGITPNTVKDVIVLKYGDPESLTYIANHADSIAAVVVEPVQSRNPALQPIDFVKTLRVMTLKHGAALIFDEMITGFRIHPGGAQAWYDIEADIVTYGKIVGGGLPIGVVSGKAQYLDTIDGGHWLFGDDSMPEKRTTVIAGTFNIHPLTMATAKAVLTEIKNQGPILQDKLNQKVSYLCDHLNRWFNENAIPVEMVCFGSLFRFKVNANTEILFYHLMEKGIFVWEGRNCFISTAHTDEDIETIIRVVKESLQSIKNAGCWF